MAKKFTNAYRNTTVAEISRFGSEMVFMWQRVFTTDRLMTNCSALVRGACVPYALSSHACMRASSWLAIAIGWLGLAGLVGWLVAVLGLTHWRCCCCCCASMSMTQRFVAAS